MHLLQQWGSVLKLSNHRAPACVGLLEVIGRFVLKFFLSFRAKRFFERLSLDSLFFILGNYPKYRAHNRLLRAGLRRMRF